MGVGPSPGARQIHRKPLSQRPVLPSQQCQLRIAPQEGVGAVITSSTSANVSPPGEPPVLPYYIGFSFEALWNHVSIFPFVNTNHPRTCTRSLALEPLRLSVWWWVGLCTCLFLCPEWLALMSAWLILSLPWILHSKITFSVSEILLVHIILDFLFLIFFHNTKYM